MTKRTVKRPRYYVSWHEGAGCPRTERSYLATVLWRARGDEYSLYLSDVLEFRSLGPCSIEIVDGVQTVRSLEGDPYHSHPDFCLEGLVELPRMKTKSHEIVYLRLSDKEIIYVERSFLDD